MKKPSNTKLFLQAILLRGKVKQRALKWPRIERLLAVHIPITDPDALALMGRGEYFEPLYTEEALCQCIAECESDVEKNDVYCEKSAIPADATKDFKPLVEFLRGSKGG